MEADWHSLPAPLLAGVLQQVNTKHRLICCALVCKSWAAAAAVATDSLRSLDWESCSSWVEHHKAQITSFHLPPARPQDFAVVSQLPSPLLAHLVELRVDRKRLQLAPSSSSPGLLQHASTLRALAVNACQVVDGQDGLMALTTLPNLQDLTLHVVLNLYRNRYEQLKLPGELLPALQHLTRLCVRLNAADNWQGLQQLGQMTVLRQLHLQGVHRVPNLCAGLRVLVLEDVQIPLSPASTPGIFAQLTALQELRLQDCMVLDPAVLQPISTLQHLVLEDIQLWEPANAAEVLLAWVGKQQQLTHLELEAGQLVASTGAQGRALTASTKLQHLRFTLSLKEEAWRQAFTADKQRQDLTCLRFVLDPVICGADLSQLVSCCPRLRDLSIRASPASQRVVIAAGPLLQLRHLTALELSGTTDPAAEVLAQMTQLVTLSLPRPNHISDAGLLQLTALTRLTLLQCWQSNPGLALMARHAGRRLDSFTNKAPFGEPSDVWQQLLQICSNSPAVKVWDISSALGTKLDLHP